MAQPLAKVSDLGLRNKLGLGLGLAIVALGLFLCWWYRPSPLKTEIIRIPNASGQLLVGRLYHAPQLPAPYPTLLLWHGVSSTKETMQPLAIDLAQQGIAVLAVDTGGFGESYQRGYSDEENLADAKAVTAYLYAHPEQFDAQHLGVGGHSMGGATALNLAADDSRIKLVVTLGMSADINRLVPPNLLMGIGLYEQFHTPYLMRLMLAQGVGEPGMEFQSYGDLTKGTARRLVISPTSDHLMEPFDATLIHETILWVRQGLAITTPTLQVTMPGRLVGEFLLVVGSGLCWGYGWREVAYARRYPRRVAIGLGIGVISAIAGSRVGAWPSLLSPIAIADLVLLAALVFPIGHYAIQYPSHLTRFLRLAGLYIGLVILVYAVVAIIPHLQELVAQPSLVLGLPHFIATMPIALVYSRWQEARSALFSSYSDSLVPRWGLLVVFLLILLPDMVKPGIVLHSIAQSALWLVRWLRQPLRINWQAPSGRSWWLLGGLVLLLAAIVYRQAQVGAFSLDYLWSALKLLVQMGVMPALLLIGLVRSPLLQRIENHIGGKVIS